MNSITVEQVAVVCWCGMGYSIPKNLYSEARRTADGGKGLTVYCPLGHEWVSNGDPEVKRLRDELARRTAQLDQTAARARSAEAQAAKAERKLRRVEKGTCPECQRHFVNVARHMKSKHAKVSTI